MPTTRLAASTTRERAEEPNGAPLSLRPDFYSGCSLVQDSPEEPTTLCGLRIKIVGRNTIKVIAASGTKWEASSFASASSTETGRRVKGVARGHFSRLRTQSKNRIPKGDALLLIQKLPNQGYPHRFILGLR
ncbi:unnamed protein product [Amoebophrya sp. A25]|nr:unnamed protein product [Amoebophrya sp. A25]|eukprot:GSA25T00019824001.1